MFLAFLFLSFLGGEVFMSFEYAIPKSGFISLTSLAGHFYNNNNDNNNNNNNNNNNKSCCKASHMGEKGYKK